MAQTFVTLNDGTKIPQFGIGVYEVPEGEATVNAVNTDAAVEGTLIVAGYAEDNALVSVSMSDVDVTYGDFSFTMDIEDSNKDVASYKVLLWDSVDNMKPMAKKEI